MTYFTIYQAPSQITYFLVDITKEFRFSAHGIEYHDYIFSIGEINMAEENKNSFNETYAGYFLWLNENKEIQIYHNSKKKYFDLNNIPDVNHIYFYYNRLKFCGLSLSDLVKEILFDIFVTSSQI